MQRLLLLCAILFSWTDQISSNVSSANFSTLARSHGFQAREFDVVTEDGYILKLFHIPGKGEPILLVHGLMDTVDSFIIRGNGSLSAALAHKGYDIWAANTRGNRYSRRHLTLSPDSDPQYWNFSFHEMGYYDIPAVIDFILAKTGKNQLSAMGHSQGNSVFYVLGATRPEYNDKVRVMIALSPVCYFHNLKPPSSALLQSLPLLSQVFAEFGAEDIFGENTLIRIVGAGICGQRIFSTLCIKGIFSPLGGEDEEELESDFFPTVIEHYPIGTSRKNIDHIYQVYASEKFRQFDYGLMNLQMYGSPSPPQYNLGLVRMKIVLLAGRNDGLAALKDVELLRDRLPNAKYIILDRKKMNHVDFIWGRNMDKYLFPYIFDALNAT